VRGALVSGLLALGAVGCGSGAARKPRELLPTIPRAAATTTRRPPTPTPGPLQRALAAALSQAGRETGADVYDLTAQRELYTLRAGVKRPPASVEKLFTSVAVLARLGAAARLHTQVLGTGYLGRSGTWHGDLYLRGDGDPTFGDGAFNRDWEEGYGPTPNQLVTQLTKRHIRRVTGEVIGDASLFDSRRGGPATGYAADIPDFGGQLAGLTYDHGATARTLSPGAFAARELVLTMRGAHMRARAARATADTPPSAKLLASVSSPPISVLLKLTDVPSDDFFAEMLTKQLGARFAGAGSIRAGAGVIAQVAEGFGVHPVIRDGSGLSRGDRASPAEIVALLRALWETVLGEQLLKALPIVGVSGTVQRIGVGTPAQGRCQAKTGTLDAVTNLAGYCRARDGHVLAFALFLDGSDNPRAITLIGKMVGAIARY
jgi:D-alanyl-D-alanine carboxypeptidase/D-alanyl-D-alanine-endopeptidase (penicillin-binding protein 4)